MRRYDGSLKSVKSRSPSWPSLAVPATAENGIEKVRGSTPLISTIRFRVQNKGFPRFLLCAAARPDRGVKGVLIHFNTLRRVQCPSGRKVCAHGKTEANGVDMGQPRPLVLLGATPRRKEAAERPAQGSRRETYVADGSPTQDGGTGRSPVLGGTYAPDTPTRSGGRVRL